MYYATLPVLRTSADCRVLKKIKLFQVSMVRHEYDNDDKNINAS